MHSKYIAAGDRVKLKTFKTADVRIKRLLKDYKKYEINIVTDYYKRRTVKNYYEKFFYETTVINTLPRSVKVEIERRFSGKYKVQNLKLKSYRVDKYTLKYFPDLKSRSKKKYYYQVRVFQGRI